MPLDPVELLCQLVAIPSVNPMGRNLCGEQFLETRLTNFLEELFGRLGLPCQRQTIELGRDNIIARLDGRRGAGSGGRQVLMFEAHQDTVPTDGMTIEPWTPTIRDGRLYGRGACDIKGGMAAMLVALSRLAEERPRDMPTVLMACTVNEEHGYSGANELKRLWEVGSDSILPRKPDAAIVAEPTNLNVVVAHKGAVRWRCHTRGRAVHSSQPELGENAIYRMGRVLLALEAYQRDVAPSFAKHPLCGGVTLSVGTIGGGISINTVPDECTIEIDRRLLPGEDSSAAFGHVVDFVAAYQGIDFNVIHDKPGMEGSTLSDADNGRLAERLAGIVNGLTGRCRRIGVPFGTDASKIAAAGVPSVVFGPGSIEQAHTADEWLPLDELAAASEALYHFARNGLD